VSRATFARICESARRKIASAMVDGKEIKTAYGNAYLEKEWFICKDCNTRFDIKAAMVENNCPVCLSLNINSMISL